MSNRVMLVDDDRLLLNSIVRNLGFDFDISVAENGPEAIDLLTTDSRYTVIVTDMRMPGMDGIQFIEAARPLAPEAVFVMLTGNHDLNCAIQAVNDGQVFRFLNKPCEMAVIKQAITAGQRQYELQRSEKDLLNKTCAGAISMLTDVLAASHSEHFSRIELYGRSLDAIRQSVGIADRWEYRLASKLALVGFACLRHEDIKRFLELHPRQAEWKALHERSAEIGSRLLQRIPRLETVASIIELHPSTKGEHCHTNPKTEKAIAQTGATLLQVAFVWDALIGRGQGKQQTLADMKEVLPELMEEYLEALKNLPTMTEELQERESPLSELQADMVLARDVTGTDGATLLRAGTRLSEAWIERLREYNSQQNFLRPIYVVGLELAAAT
jgi:FixJ family two-component response regulator